MDFRATPEPLRVLFRSLEPLGGLLGRSWGVLGVLLVALGTLLHLSLAFLGLRRALGPKKDHLGSISGSIFGRFWVDFRSIFG